jgi:cytochrome o ubiquinol oxidase operon protein cyoD
MMDRNHRWSVSFKPVIVGFLLSVVLILAAYFMVVGQVFTGWMLSIAVITLATVQSLLQLVLFMRLGIESKPHWNLLTFLFMLLILVVVVGGSLWIMYSLNYMMPMMDQHH